jgi:hypothetical protein
MGLRHGARKNPASAATTNSQYRLFGGPTGMILPPEVLLERPTPGIAQAEITPSGQVAHMAFDRRGTMLL